LVSLFIFESTNENDRFYNIIILLYIIYLYNLIFKYLIYNIYQFLGFGYHYPTSDGMRMFTVFYMLIGIYFVFFIITDFVTTKFSTAAEFIRKQVKVGELGEDYRYYYRLMVYNVFAVFLVILVSAGIFSSLEDWSYAKALYFTVEAFTVSFLYGKYMVNIFNPYSVM
jgi:hypothetical protein